MPLYQPENPYSRGQKGLEDASKTTAAMDKKQFQPPKTAGGAVMSAAGGALTAATIGEVAGISALTGGTGLAIAAGVGLLAYFLG